MNASQKLKKLEEKREQLEARIKNIEASELTRAKKEDTRRKILIGAFYMEQMEKHEDLKTKVLAFLDGFLVRPMDRKLFGLPEKPEVKNQPPEQSTGEKNEVEIKKTTARRAN